MSAILKPGTLCAELDEQQSLDVALARCNELLARVGAAERIRWALEHLPTIHVLSSSFGAQAAVSLHMLTHEKRDIPVILTDTGYLFPETYRFIDEMTDRFDLNLKVYRSPTSPAWQEARHGPRWHHDAENFAAYNAENKTEPMKRALRELKAGTWFAGLRRSQASSRQAIQFLERHGERWKVHPIADWSDRDMHCYLTRNRLPYHPLWDKGYVSIGDVHTTRSLHAVDNPEDVQTVENIIDAEGELVL